MLKRLLLVCIALALFLPAGLAEQSAPQLIEAQEDEKTAMQIRSLDGDRAVGILGVESEPIPRRWEDFSTVFASFLKKNWDEDVRFSDVLWSNGRWVRVFDAVYVVMQVYTADPTPDGQVQEVLLMGYHPECAPDVQVLSGAAFWAAAQYGDYGKYTMQILFMEDHSEDWFTKEPLPVWRENGFQLSFGQTGLGCPQGRIEFSEEVPVVGGYAPLDPEGMENIRAGRTAEELFSALKAAAENGPLGGMITAPRLPEEWQTAADERMYQITWDDCLLVLYTDGDGQCLRSATLACMSGDTVSACAHLYPLYAAAAGLGDDAVILLPDIVGGHGTWMDMCALSPYCVINGVMLQCSVEEIGEESLPTAFICGALEME